MPHDLPVTLSGSVGGSGGGSVAADTFADFVDHLAEVLANPQLSSSGDGDATGEEWAARFHFSRYHFDRMIRSVAGEPPQAFRRRILLERAAYRMVTTTAPLIDIAVEAGHRSHQGVTPAVPPADRGA